MYDRVAARKGGPDWAPDDTVRPNMPARDNIEPQTRGNRENMKPLWIVLGLVALLIVVLLFFGGSYIGSRNQMVAKDQNVQAAFSEIDVNLQRRADLIPNLVATVKGYANVEENVLNNIAQAWSGRLQARMLAGNLGANDTPTDAN